MKSEQNLRWAASTLAEREVGLVLWAWLLGITLRGDVLIFFITLFLADAGWEHVDG